MEILPSLLGYISSRVKVAKRNISDLVTDTGNALEKTAANTAQTINETIKDPMSFAGAGTLIGKNAKLFSTQEAGKAMEKLSKGQSIDSISQETGTWLGHPDKAMRQEISDLPARVDPNHLLTDMNAERYLSTEPVRFTKDGAKLGDVLNHPSLFANYPELKDVNLLYGHGTKKASGYYDPAKNEMLVVGRTPEEALSVLIHEVQHAVQKKESWSPGAALESIPFDSRTKQQYRQMILDAKNSGKIDLTDKTAVAQADRDMRLELYKKTAGEADARVAQKRQFLTPEELKQYPINQSWYDIPLKDMLIGKP